MTSDPNSKAQESRAHANPLLSIAEARRLILETVPLRSATSAESEGIAAQDLKNPQDFVDLAHAAGFVLAETVYADRDAPPFDRAMMDGYAIQSSDFARRTTDFTYRVAGKTILAGTRPTGDLEAGTCRRIMTGAPLPPGADCVIPFEETREFQAAGDTREPAVVHFSGVDDPAAIYSNRFVAPRGSDVREGQAILAAGSPIDGAAMNVLATFGCARVPVRRLPSVVILSTGDEIAPVTDQNIAPERIRDSNYYALCAGLAAYRAPPPVHRIIPDEPAALRSAVVQALTEPKADLLILSGGVSMGDADFVPAILTEAEIEKVFHRVDVKPGKPLWFGRARNADGPVVFGLPGNPIAVQVGWKIFIEPWLRAWLGLEPVLPIWRLPLATGRRKHGSRPEFFPARLSTQENSPSDASSGHANTAVVPMRIHSSGDVSATIGSRGFALHPGDRPEISAGEIVEFYPHARMD